MKKVFCAVFAVMAGFFLIAQGAAGADDLKIGIMVPTTGSEATYGKDMENAISMAVKEINAKGGVLGKKIVTTTGDAACDPQQATSAASKLVSEDVVGVVGGYCSGATLPTLKIYGDAGVPFVIAAANSTKLIPANPGNAFLINSTGSDQAATAVELFTKKGYKKLAIVHQGDGYSEDLAKLTREKWEAAGNKVVAFEVVNKGEQDHSSLVTSIKSKAPDVVFWTAYYADGALVIKQLRQGGYTKQIAVGDGSNSPKLMEIAGKAAEGVFCFSNPTVEYLPAAKAFSGDYKKSFKQDPGPYSALAYDGIYLMADAMKRAGSADKKAIMAALKATKDFKGIAGSISFTPENTLAISNFVVLVAKGAKWDLYK
ncbi:branched-chain amino acid ABC transporter substrate-binding protein [Desulfococcaceae bacterium HSG8]|nr:branched-chain amino acid ABC transporter substrate-binding protein [Desulfococcaceae bacterium HSG8]